MKRKLIKYSIEEPCHADWDQMKPEAKGRFCESCSKIVVDFSSMSDFSIVNYLEGKKNGSVCGRFRPSQMDQVYSLPRPHQQFHFDLKAVALGLALSTFSAIHLNAQVAPPIQNMDTLQVKNEPLDGMVSYREFYDHSDERFTSGAVSVDGKGYGFTTIQLMDMNGNELFKTSPEKDGKFKILLDWSKNPSYLLISGSGLVTRGFFFKDQKSIKDQKIILFYTRNDSREY